MVAQAALGALCFMEKLFVLWEVTCFYAAGFGCPQKGYMRSMGCFIRKLTPLLCGFF